MNAVKFEFVTSGDAYQNISKSLHERGKIRVTPEQSRKALNF